MKLAIALGLGIVVGALGGAVWGSAHQLNQDAEMHVANRDAECSSWVRVRTVEAERGRLAATAKQN